MKILQFTAENYKRLSAVEITPTGAVVEIVGRNAQGKSSVLDAIFAALAGKSAIPSKPIHKGADEARIELKLGTGETVDMVVRRTFQRRADDTFTTSVVVEHADGARYMSPQTLLDGLLGSLSFDPLAFARMEPKQQLEQLRKLVPGVDFAALDEANRVDYEERTRINRQVKALQAQVAAVVVPEGPWERVDESALVAELEAVGEKKAAIERERSRRYALKDDVRHLEVEVETREDRIQQLRAQIAEYEEELVDLRPKLEARRAAFDALPPLEEAPDTSAIKARIDAARKTNADITERERVAKRRDELAADAKRQQQRSDELTKAIDQRNKDKAAAVAAANLPIEGLAFGANEVLFNGLPLDQASDAERLRVSVAIAAALNPKLRVIRVRDGSLLDTDGLRMLGEFAAKHELQVWLERVADGSPVGIVIEDGRVKAAEEAA